jgi:hypothetical protein
LKRVHLQSFVKRSLSFTWPLICTPSGVFAAYLGLLFVPNKLKMMATAGLPQVRVRSIVNMDQLIVAKFDFRGIACRFRLLCVRRLRGEPMTKCQWMTKYPQQPSNS